MRNRLLLPLFLIVAVSFLSFEAMHADQTHPTPPVVVIGTSTATPQTPEPIEGDHLEPNNSLNSAAVVGLQTESNLTLDGKDIDFYTGFVKVGQTLALETYVYDGLDTKVTVYWAGQQIVFNDDKDPLDTGSLAIFTPSRDGWFTAVVEKVGLVDGSYDLAIYLEESPTPQPTATPLPTVTPRYFDDEAEPNDAVTSAFPITVGAESLELSLLPNNTDFFKFVAKVGQTYQCETVSGSVDTVLAIHSYGQVIVSNDDRAVGRVDSFVSWVNDIEQEVYVEVGGRGGSFGAYTLSCSVVEPTIIYFPPLEPTQVIEREKEDESLNEETGGGDDEVDETAVSTRVVPNGAIPFLIRPMGQLLPEPTIPQQYELVVYYDQNNNRQADPGEGIANVSVLAVDRSGQRVARVFTNSDGEAVFNRTDSRISRFVVPFVSSWSARAVPNQPAILGLPAVRIPVFLPLEATDE